MESSKVPSASKIAAFIFSSHILCVSLTSSFLSESFICNIIYNIIYNIIRNTFSVLRDHLQRTFTQIFCSRLNIRLCKNRTDHSNSICTASGEFFYILFCDPTDSNYRNFHSFADCFQCLMGNLCGICFRAGRKYRTYSQIIRPMLLCQKSLLYRFG